MIATRFIFYLKVMFLNFMNIMKTSCSFYYSLTDNVASWIVFSRCPFVGVFVNTITHKHLRHYPEIFMGARYGRVANSPGLTRILRVSTFDLRSSGLVLQSPG